MVAAMSIRCDAARWTIAEETKEQALSSLVLSISLDNFKLDSSAMHNVTAALRSLSLASRRSLSTSAPRLEQQAEQAVASTSAWTPETQRTGVLARKLGMTALWQEGIRVPVTVLHVSSEGSYPARVFR